MDLVCVGAKEIRSPAARMDEGTKSRVPSPARVSTGSRTVASASHKGPHALPATPYIAFTSVPPNDSPKRVLIRLTFN
jgi:hypothetical protein